MGWFLKKRTLPYVNLKKPRDGNRRRRREVGKEDRGKGSKTNSKSLAKERRKGMRKRVLFGLSMAMLIALSLGIRTMPEAYAQPKTEKITLGFVHPWPVTHFMHADQMPRYFKMVEKAAGGKYALDIKYFPVSTLLGGAEIYDGVVKGIADSGTTSLGWTPGKFPAMLTLNQPGIAPPESSDAAAHTIWEFYRKYKPKEFDDTKVLYVYATGPGWLHTKKPVRTVADMKGLKIRVTGPGIQGVKAVGGEPVAMVMGETYLAAQKGIIDALIGPAETLEGWKHHEVFDYSTFVPHFYSEFFWVGMNLAKWKALPKDLQDAFDAVAEEAMKEAGQIWQFMQKRGADFAKRQTGGHELLYLPEAEVAKLKKLLEPIAGEYAASLKARGLPGEEMVKEAGRIVEKYNKMKFEPWKP